jgi:hypothetical protein
VRAPTELLDEMGNRIAAHARQDLTTSIDGLLLSNVPTTAAAPEYSVTHPLLVVMAEGGKRLLLGDRVIEYGRGDCLVITANLPVTGHWIDSDSSGRALGMGLELRPAAIAELLLKAPDGAMAPGHAGHTSHCDGLGRARATGRRRADAAAT